MWAGNGSLLPKEWLNEMKLIGQGAWIGVDSAFP